MGGEVLVPLSGLGIGDGLTYPAVQVLTKPLAAYGFGLINGKEVTTHTLHITPLLIFPYDRPVPSLQRALKEGSVSVSGCLCVCCTVVDGAGSSLAGVALG